MQKLKKIGIGVVFTIAISVLFAFKSDFFEVAKQIEIYTTLFKELNLYYIDEVNPAKLTDKAINNMLNELDPYTRFYDEQSVEEAKINSLGEYSGVGIQTKFYDKKLVIKEVYEGFSADKSGIKIGDEILKIDQTDIKDFNHEQVETLLKGVADSPVSLQVKRQGKILNFNLKREKIELNPVPHYQMIGQDIGYIPLIKFNNKASSSVKEAFVDLKSKGMKKVILDLRGNLGGLLNEAVNITNLFVPKNEVVVTTKAKLKKWSETYRTRNEPVDLEIPVVVLIDKESASASEIVAGSLQDMDRAVIVGQRSYGKGLVQRYRNLTYGTKLKLTISKYYTPSGRNIQELDYTNREGNTIPKFSDQKPNAFQTKNGRTVYDGGGIAPDILVKVPKTTKSSEALFASDAIFNFANNYYYKHTSIENAQNFVFQETNYQDFINYLKQENSSFKTQTEHRFEKSFATAEKENLSKGIVNSYQEVLQGLQKQKIDELTPNQEEIKQEITNEILHRYYYIKGAYQYQIIHNKSILKAVSILNNNTEYNNILNNE